MTFSIELFPAPFGPMMARTSCSRTSNVMSCSAFTPPNARKTCSSERMTSPMRRAGSGLSRDGASRAGLTTGATPIATSGSLLHRGGKNCRVLDAQVGGHQAGAPVLELDERLDVLDRTAGVERIDQHAVFFGDESAPHLARARQLVVVGIELLVQDQEAAHLRIGEARLARELRVHLLDAAADQRVDLGLRGKIGVAGIGNAAALRPVAHRSEVDVDERAHVIAAGAERHRFLDVRKELEL